MPATEETWRNQTTMHLVFGISSLLMLGTTIWMLAADHTREWKDVQRKFRKLEAWTAENRIAQERTESFETRTRELKQALVEAAAEVPDQALVEQFVEVARAGELNVEARLERAQQYYQELAGKPSADGRGRLMSELEGVIGEAQRREANAQQVVKFARADLDVLKSNYDQGVGESLPAPELARRESAVQAQQARVAELAEAYQDANTLRVDLERLVAQMNAHRDQLAKELDDHVAGLVRLDRARREAVLTPAEQLLTLPILDGFGRPLKVEQIWLPNLTINNNFRDVARFDRCITCHQGMEKTAPGSAVEPGYPQARELVLALPTPAEPPNAEPAEGRPAPTYDELLEQVYGLRLARVGLRPHEVTVESVKAMSPASQALIEAGDVILAINDASLETESGAVNRDQANLYLLERVNWGQPLALRVRRGVGNPYSSHPRLDLFVGPLSPHKLGEMGCTICHDGQGSGTEFKWASHTPDNPAQREVWIRDHAWFDNHHWIFPMRPARFVESNCLKCHHQVTELEPSQRFPEPPAPRLMAGFNLIKDFGCFGCHEINGYNGPDQRIGPDLRAEPNVFAAAQQVLADPNLARLGPTAVELARSVVAHPERDAERKRLAEMIRADAAQGGDSPEAQPVLSATSHRMATLLGADYETPGQLRKVGPSLRHLGSKVDLAFLYSWLSNPQDFRPSTKMPRFFGLHEHLLPEPKVDESGQVVMKTEVDASGHTHEVPVMEESAGLREALRFEPVEIRAAATFLLAASQPFEYAARPAEVTEEPSPERGKVVFELRGCLACHKHQDFPEAQSTQGPDLSRIGAKLTTPEGAQWLYSWVREPNRYHSRTVMPDLKLEPIAEGDGKVSDPAADVTAFLLGSKGWEAPPVPEVVKEDLDALALMHLRSMFTDRQAARYLAGGIPADLAGELKGDEIELVGSFADLDPAVVEGMKLRYVGRKTISKLGCAGCHDIPGYEESKPIGTALADWGRKDPAKLAFELIGSFLARTMPDAVRGGEHLTAHPHPEFRFRDMDPDTGFFMQSLMHHQREGFLWQKLRAPRSYDYRKTENKPYNDRLRMPKFPFDQQQIEQIMTFVLGLVSESPKDTRFVYQAEGDRKAIVDGREVLEKYNCGGCHMLELPQWTFDYDPATFAGPPVPEEYEFLLPHFTPEQLAASRAVDRRGLGRASVNGWPVLNDQGELLEAEDDEGNPANFFSPWEAVAINGEVWLPGGPDLLVPTSRITAMRPARGGDLAQLLHPRVFAAELAVNPNAKSTDAWGWVPPPLVGEGRKVQTNWLHNFLLDPYPIRPAVVLRMPKFNLSSEEATKLVNYFAAADGVVFPYVFDPRTRASHLAAAETAHPNRLADALKIVTDRNYCVQCHRVGDFTPEGSIRAQAPNLDRIYQRIRPDFLRDWIANPKRLLPYTGMPVNFPLGKPANQALYHGDSLEQIDAVVDLLLNYDQYMSGLANIRAMVPPPVAAPPEGAAPAAAGEETGGGD